MPLVVDLPVIATILSVERGIASEYIYGFKEALLLDHVI